MPPESCTNGRVHTAETYQSKGSLLLQLQPGLGREQLKENIMRAFSDEDNDNPPSTTTQGAVIQPGTGGTHVYADQHGEQSPEKPGKKRDSGTGNAVVSQDPRTDADKLRQAQRIKNVRRQQQEAKGERERIIKQIESDKAERRQKEKLRKAIANHEAQHYTANVNGLEEETPSSVDKAEPIAKRDCNLQIRTLDGSIIRRKFRLDQNVRPNVRDWIEQENANGGMPYTLRQILTPLPNKIITDTDEGESLGALGLAPSATLIMLPVKTSPAYNAHVSFASRTMAVISGILTGWLEILLNYFRTFLGMWQTKVSQDDGNTATKSEATSTGKSSSHNPNIKLRRLHDYPERRDDSQVYNGNQLNFQPRNDDDKGNDH